MSSNPTGHDACGTAQKNSLFLFLLFGREEFLRHTGGSLGSACGWPLTQGSTIQKFPTRDLSRADVSNQGVPTIFQTHSPWDRRFQKISKNLFEVLSKTASW